MRMITAEDLASVGLDLETVCLRKKPYSEATARDVAERARKRSGHMNIRAYKCPVDPKNKHWHVGHESRRLRYLREDIRNGKK